MGPRSSLGRAEAIILRLVAERVVETEARGNVYGGVFEERFASKVVRMVVMMVRAGHLEGRLLE